MTSQGTMGQPQESPETSVALKLKDNPEFNSYVTALKYVWKGENTQGIDLVDNIKHFWLVTTSVLVFISALVNTFFIGRISGQPGMGFLRFAGGNASIIDLLDTRESYMGFSVGQIFGLFFKHLLLITIIYCLRAGVLVLAAKVRKHNFSFTRALGLVSFAYLPSLLLLLIIFILAIIPGSITLRLGIFILSATLIPLILFAELIMYIGLNQHNQIQKSALVPYTLFTGAGFLIVGLILGSLTTNFGG